MFDGGVITVYLYVGECDDAIITLDRHNDKGMCLMFMIMDLCD